MKERTKERNIYIFAANTMKYHEADEIYRNYPLARDMRHTLFSIYTMERGKLTRNEVRGESVEPR
jgi:hypothetical protein